MSTTTASSLSFKTLRSEFPQQLVLPFYHMINDSDVAYVKHLYSYRDVAGFVADLDFLLEHYTPVDLHQVRESVKSGTPLPDHSFFLSFDDGFRELFEIVRPILLEKGIPATFFINKAFLDNKDFFYRNKASLLIEHFLTHRSDIEEGKVAQLMAERGRLYTDFKSAILAIEYDDRGLIDEVGQICGLDYDAFLKEHQPYLTTEQVETMIADGFTFGAHSIDHPKYCTIHLDEQIRQTTESMDFVAEKFNLDYRVFAFPFHDNRVSRTFFNHIHKEVVELSFGTAEMIPDTFEQNIQRQWFENTDLNAEDLLALRYSEKKERVESGTDLRKRPYAELRPFTVGQLKKALETNLFWEGDGPIPITKYRALAHTRNPRAKDSDLAMMTMYHHDEMVGYLGVLPDKLYLGDEVVDWGWLTCWWTHPEHTKQGIGMDIINQIYEDLDGKVGCSEFTDLGKKAAERSGLLQALEIPGKIYRFGIEQEQGEEQEVRADETQVEYVNAIDPETEAFIQAHRKDELCRRSTAELNWMLQNPWVLSAPTKDRTAQRFFFSSVATRFFYQAVKVFDADNQMIGFFILRIRDNHMKVLYFYSAENTPDVVKVIAKHVKAYGVTELKTYNTEVISALERLNLPFSAVEEHVKYCFFSGELDLERVKGKLVQDGDGDNGFT